MDNIGYDFNKGFLAGIESRDLEVGELKRKLAAFENTKTVPRYQFEASENKNARLMEIISSQAKAIEKLCATRGGA
jgi:hypothetical protein